MGVRLRISLQKKMMNVSREKNGYLSNVEYRTAKISKLENEELLSFSKEIPL